MPILSIAITTIECDGHHGSPCPSSAVIEYPHPQSVSIRLAKQSGWTVWIETMCPECSRVQTPEDGLSPLAPVARKNGPAAPAVKGSAAGSGAEDASGWCALFGADRSSELAGV